MTYVLNISISAATSGLSFFTSFRLTRRAFTRNAHLRAGSTHLPAGRSAASLKRSSGSSPPPGSCRPVERRRTLRLRGGLRRPAVRLAAAAGQAAAWRGWRAPTDRGGVVRGDRSTGRRPPCVVGTGGWTRRLPGVGRTRLRCGRGGLNWKAARVGSGLGRRRRHAQAVGGRDGGRLGRGRQRRDRDPVRPMWPAAVREPRGNPSGPVTGRRARRVARVVGGQSQEAPRARAGRAGGVEEKVGCGCDVR